MTLWLLPLCSLVLIPCSETVLRFCCSEPFWPIYNMMVFPSCVLYSVSKGSLIASIVFILERKGLIDAPHAIVYFCVVIFFVHFRLMSLLIGFNDPFVPVENLFCAVFMGGMWDAMRRAVTKEKAAPDSSGTDLRNGIKNKEEKKND